MDIISRDNKDLVCEIFLKMNIKMYNISFDILRSHSDAEEAVSQTFLKIMEHSEKISALPCPKIEPYCIVILKNETMNVIRKRRKMVYIDDIDCLEYSDKNHDIEGGYIQSAEKERLLSYVNRLPGDERSFIYFRFVHEMSFKQIGVLLNITEGTARKRGQRILKKLRSYYVRDDKNG